MTLRSSCVPLLALVGSMLLLTGCPKTGVTPAGAVIPADNLVGMWKDEVGAYYKVDLVDRQPQVVQIIDSDGEVFVVESSGWEASQFVFYYRVPSTDYRVVTTVTGRAGDDKVITWWENSGGDKGEGFMERQ